MLKKHKSALQMLFQLVDVLTILLSFILAYYLRFNLEKIRGLDFSIEFKSFLFVYVLAWLLLSKFFRLYTSKRLISRSVESLDLVKTTIVALLISVGFAFFWRQQPLSRFFLFYFWLIHTANVILCRFVIRTFLQFIRLRGYNFRHVVIVGCNQRAENLANKILKNPEYGIRILGYVDDQNNKNGFHALSDLPQLGNLRDIEKILRNNVVDEVIVTLPMKSYYCEMEKVIYLGEEIGIEVKIPADLFNHRLAKSSIANYCGIAVIGFYSSPRMCWQLLAKRIMDATLSGILLVALSPLFVIVSIVIKATTEGPILFVQERLGYNGRRFNLIKFRTMVKDAEALKKDLVKLNEMDGPVFKIKRDPRVTRVGRFLRKSSIDELPQLVSVLKGDMSLVGPRPPLATEVCEYELRDRRRLSMKPGITCIWQANGRNSIGFEKWMELDRMYIDRWSLWLDLKILVKTVPAILRGSGAA